MSIAAEGGTTPLTVPDAAARVPRFTQVARPEDLPLVLNALSTVELDKNLGEARIYQLVAGAPSVERLHFLLKKFGRYLGFETCTLLYGQPAAAAGPEPGWDVATMLAGSLQDVGPFVRASMAAGGAEPLLLGAETIARRDLPGITVPDPDRPSEPHPEDPASWPLGTAVRQHLDNQPLRWRTMVRRLMAAGPLEYAQLVDLVQTLESVRTAGGRQGEAAEGKP